MKRALFILAAVCTLWSSSLPAQTLSSSTTFVLNGTIRKVNEGSKVYLVYQADGKKLIDSSLIANHQFHFIGSVASPVFATLALDHDFKGLRYLFKKPVDEIDVLKLYLHPGVIGITTQDSLMTAVFTASAINKDYSRLNAILNMQDERRLYHLSAQMQKLRTPESEKLYVAFDDSLKQARRPLLKRFAEENPGSYIALVALKEYAGAFPDTAAIKPLFKALLPDVRNTKAGIEFDMLLNSDIAAGTIAPDFTQNDVHGKPLKLSWLRGKFVLVDFWASWCPSCREESPKLVKAFNELKDQNFTILGVSLDGQDTRTAWLKAIKDDGLNWPQVSDLKHWDNSVIKLYGINAIPQNVLIDDRGKVIAKNIDPAEIKEWLEKAKMKE